MPRDSASGGIPSTGESMASTSDDEPKNTREPLVLTLAPNVGLSYEYPNEFLNLESSAVDDIINVNISSLNAMTRILLKVDRFSLQFSINGSLYWLILLAMHIFKIFFSTYLAYGRTEKWCRYQCIFSKWNNGKKKIFFFFWFKLCL